MDNAKEQIVKYNIGDVFVSTLLFFACIFYRPMIFGEKYSIVGLGLFAAVIVVCLAINHGKVETSKNSRYKTYLAAMALFSYCSVQAIILESDHLAAALQTCLLLAVSVTAFFLAFSKKSIETVFIKILYIVMIAFALSYAVTAILMFLKGWDAILITDLDYNYIIKSSIYVPFTTTYGDMWLGPVRFRRLLGFARECGLMQIFYAWGFFSADQYFKKYGIVRIIMVMGIMACFSTTGFIVFSFSLLLYFDIRKLFSRKSIIVLALVVIGVYILFFASGTKILDRAPRTINERTIGMLYGLSKFFQKPLFGGGLYSSLGNPNIQTGISAIASLGQIGIVGLLLWLLTYLFSFIDCHDKRRFLYTNASLFITTLFAQPIIFAPVMYWFLFVNTDKKIVAQRMRYRRWD